MVAQAAAPSPHDEVADALVVHLTETSGVRLVRPVGEIDIATGARLDERLAGVDGTVVVDLTWVPFIDSSGFEVLNAHRQRVERAGGTFRIRGANQLVTRVFEILGLGAWLDD